MRVGTLIDFRNGKMQHGNSDKNKMASGTH